MIPSFDKGEANHRASFMNDLSWTCHICGENRPDAKISVFKTDLSAKHNLPPGTVMQNTRYCNDNSDCVEGAKTHEFFGKK